MPCNHGVQSDFKTAGQWTCSHCGKRAAWGTTWAYYGNLECRKCGLAAIDFVVCSDECQRAFEESRKLEADVVKDRKRKAHIEQLDRQIADLHAHRSRLEAKTHD